MKKLFEKDEVMFAVIWIVIYVVGFSAADSVSESIGMPKVLTVLIGAAISAALLLFIGKNGLWEYFGICRMKVGARKYIYYIPLVLIASVNLWCGAAMRFDILTCLLYVISMCFVGFIEEIIFRGFLFKGMCRSDIKAAIIVSSLTFGAGHIINLLLGEPVLDTLLQLVYACAVGFCFTAIFYTGKSLLPCIVTHAAVNSLSAFAVEPTNAVSIITAISITVLGIGYGIWILRICSTNQEKKILKYSKNRFSSNS